MDLATSSASAHSRAKTALRPTFDHAREESRHSLDAANLHLVRFFLGLGLPITKLSVVELAVDANKGEGLDKSARTPTDLDVKVTSPKLWPYEIASFVTIPSLLDIRDLEYFQDMLGGDKKTAASLIYMEARSLATRNATLITNLYHLLDTTTVHCTDFPAAAEDDFEIACNTASELRTQ